jgi:hypothetical protein
MLLTIHQTRVSRDYIPGTSYERVQHPARARTYRALSESMSCSTPACSNSKPNNCWTMVFFAAKPSIFSTVTVKLRATVHACTPPQPPQPHQRKQAATAHRHAHARTWLAQASEHPSSYTCLPPPPHIRMRRLSIINQSRCSDTRRTQYRNQYSHPSIV